MDRQVSVPLVAVGGGMLRVSSADAAVGGVLDSMELQPA